MDKLADIWRGRCKDDVENGTALQWRTVEEQIEVQRVMRPKVGGGALTLVDGDRGSQRAAFHVSRLVEKVGREFGSPTSTAVDWYWLISQGLECRRSGVKENERGGQGCQPRCQTAWHKRPVQLADSLMDLQERVSGMLEDVHRSSGGVSDPGKPMWRRFSVPTGCQGGWPALSVLPLSARWTS